MIRLHGRGILSSWRPYEEGRGGAAMRASEKECESITVFDQIVLAQHKDGFWEVLSFSNCTVTWMQKPEMTLVDEATGAEHPIEITGKTGTMADTMRYGLRRPDSNSFKPMESTEEVDTRIS